MIRTNTVRPPTNREANSPAAQPPPILAETQDKDNDLRTKTAMTIPFTATQTRSTANSRGRITTLVEEVTLVAHNSSSNQKMVVDGVVVEPLAMMLENGKGMI